MPGGGLELDGGFALVGCSAADAQDRGRSVEQAAHAARARAVDVSLDHRGRDTARLLIEAAQDPRGTRMLEQTEFAEQGKGVASGVAHRCGTAGKCPGT